SAVLVAVIGLGALQHASDRHYGTHSSIHRASGVIYGCIAYRNHPQSGGKYPASLDELQRPSFKGGPFLEDPNYDLHDAWGNRLRYAVVVNEKGEAEAYAWAERTDNAKTYLCGAKGTADGTIVLFGLPE